MSQKQGKKSDQTAAGTAPTTTPTRTVAHITTMALEAPPTLPLAETQPRSLEAAARNRGRVYQSLVWTRE